MPDYTVEISRRWRRVAGGDAHRSFTMTVQRVAGGTWQAEWPLAHTGARRMFRSVEAAYNAGGPTSADLEARQWGVAVRPRGSLTYAAGGFCTGVGIKVGEVSGASSGDSIVATGYCDDAILAGTTVYPDHTVDAPTGTPGHPWATATDDRTEPAGQLLAGLVRDNLAASPIPRRLFTLLEVPTATGVGPAVTYGRRFPTLLEAAHTLAGEGDLVVRVVRQASATQPLLLLVQTRVERTNMRLSTIAGGGTLRGVQVMYGSAGAFYALAGGQGEGTARSMLLGSVPQPAQGAAYPRELFVDAASADSTDKLQSANSEALADVSAQVGVTLATGEVLPWQLGRHFQPGDLLPVDAGTTTVPASPVLVPVEEVTLSHLRGEPWLTKPKLGAPISDPTVAQRRLLRDLASRRKI